MLGSVVALVVAGAVGASVPAAPGAGAADPTFTVGPASGLVDSQDVSVHASGLHAGVTYIVVECGPEAIAILAGSWPDGDVNPEDGCDAQSAVTLFTGDGDTVSGSTRAHVILNAAVGPIDCRAEQCFIALFPLRGDAPLYPQNLTFAADACAAVGSCVVGDRPGVAGHATPAPARPTPAPPVVATAEVGAPAALTVGAGVAGDLTAPDSVTGPVTGAFTAPVAPSPPVSGEGIVRLDLSAPGTDWGANVPSAVVADVRLDGGDAQQLVLFGGATPFVYAAGLGPLTTGDHTVTVAVDDALSHAGAGAARVDVHDVQLLVVQPSNARYATIHFAPVLYGRSTSALHDTPLLEYGSTRATASGSSSSYTMVFSHEDSGTAFVPFMESGVWGRTTDIESFFTADVDAAGTPTGGHFLSGATPDDYPDTQNAIAEPTVSYTSGNWVEGSHGVLRVATGNNDFSQHATTPFRFRPVPVPAPAPGEPREAVMDTHPWTYRIAGEEVARWYTNFTTDPTAPEQGDARQYAYVQLDSSGSGVDHVAVDVQLDGGPTWYANDFGSGYPTGGTGTDRTVVKLPLDWLSHTITAVRIRVFPAAAASSFQVQHLRVVGLDADWTLHEVDLPEASVVDGFLYVPFPETPASTTTSTAPPASGPTTSTPGTTEPGTGPGSSAPGPTTPVASAARPVGETPAYTG